MEVRPVLDQFLEGNTPEVADQSLEPWHTILRVTHTELGICAQSGNEAVQNYLPHLRSQFIDLISPWVKSAVDRGNPTSDGYELVDGRTEFTVSVKKAEGFKKGQKGVVMQVSKKSDDLVEEAAIVYRVGRNGKLTFNSLAIQSTYVLPEEAKPHRISGISDTPEGGRSYEIIDIIKPVEGQKPVHNNRNFIGW